ncbi:hypothetical protein OIY81_3012 [Cryptosporidium canis]|uniref:Uncharacterized protein n=1 Tax=Cryptosporidium canis TaxID=195482 RepID=A0ABQ8PAV5_9CRYT|nr:hypothetical protein OIY81_3012 [Cryptosporidium canis]KAJ1614879.1 hypothetical protein OJ252_433 [Cryptosporidium canis]
METCTDEKKKFEECFKEWLNKGVLTGDFGSPCENEWRIYERCLAKELKEKNLLDIKPFTAGLSEKSNKVADKIHDSKAENGVEGGKK